MFDGSVEFALVADPGNDFVDRSRTVEHDPDCPFDILSLMRTETGALQSHPIDGLWCRPVPFGDRVRKNVFVCERAGDQKTVSAYPYELSDADQSAQQCMMFDRDVPGQLCRVRDHNVVFQFAVVAQMGEGHYEIVVADPRSASPFERTEADADVFTDAVVVADYEVGFALTEAVVLSRAAEHGAALDQIPHTDSDLTVGAADARMRLDDGVVTDRYVALDHAEWSDRSRRGDLSVGRNDRRWVDAQAELSWS